jgi:serine/threonine-protein kinase
MSETVVLPQGLPGHVGPGLVIAGKYRLEEEIGRGSMGTVYRAQHVSLGTRFAIKLIASEHSQSQDARRRFSVEAKAVAKLRSRHVVQVYDDGETPQGNPYIVLEYLEGETLEQRVEREQDLPLVDAVRVTKHVGRALARAHAHGIVHRDLKPANVFLTRTDEDEAGWIAKVLDFGIAKLDDHGDKGTTQAGTVLGTPLFMSPEQVRGASSVDHRADLYSLGMCLYYMLTGDFAFNRPNFSDVLIAICNEPLPLLRENAPWAPEAVDRWFQRACSKQPLDRFQSADEMIEALVAAAGAASSSQHQSVPELRVAPETLVGYAAPALLTLDPRSQAPLVGAPTSSPNLNVTAVLDPGRGATVHSAGATRRGLAPAAPARAMAIAIESSRANLASQDFQLPVRNLQPLWIGMGLGLLAVASIAATLTFLGGSERAVPSATSPALSSPPAKPSPPALDSAQAAAPNAPTIAAPAAATPSPAAPTSTRTGSSVAAEPAATAAPKNKAKRAPPSERPLAQPKPPSSDLGF